MIFANGRIKFLLSTLLIGSIVLRTAPAQAQSFERIEASFAIANLTSDPFDYEKTDVQVQLQKPDSSTVTVPAFFNGGTTWRVRYTPLATGTYRLATITLNGRPTAAINVQPRQWKVNRTPRPGFVRIDKRNPRRFAFENGQRYFPVGHNAAWKNTRDPSVPEMLAKMGIAGENWARIWMNHWDDKNLDWPSSYTSLKLGELNLDVARKWDYIVEAAERSGIYLQPVFQHHGQYSTRTDPNWNDNPYNTARGGFLSDPKEFFTNAQAKALTRRKLRYAVARWGYSPNIMAWELWNEVQFTDAAQAGQWDIIAAWHNEMAAFLRSQDINRHLITTSSEIPVQVYGSLDYFQHHVYPPDIIVAARNPQNRDAMAIAKPNFAAESGMGDVQPYGMHALLWASLMSNQAGASQPWFWDVIARQDLYSVFTPVQKFVRRTRLAERDNLIQTEPAVNTPALADLILRPRRGTGASDQFEFVINSEGAPANIRGLSSFFPGQNTSTPARPNAAAANAAASAPAQAPTRMTPHPLVFKVDYAQPNRLTINLGRVWPAGARLKVSVDGQSVVERELAPSPAPQRGTGGFGTTGGETIRVEIPTGPHSITVENIGQDGVQIRDFTFANTIKALASYGVTNGEWAAMWIYHRGQIFSPDATQTASGKIAVTGLQAGQYRAEWWDTTAGRVLNTVAVNVTDAAQPVQLDIPPVVRDVALLIEK
ncbi:MAG TPA: DUF5060 domain-containing protein [Abditibacteriaceae bacterium]|jgi:hypothetical protein